MELHGIENLRTFLRQMKMLDADSPKMVKGALNEVAELVAVEARKRAPVKSGRLKRSIRANSTTGKARVSEGSRAVLYAGFIDYGGTVGRYRSGEIHRSARRAYTARHFAVRPYIKTGRILYPAYNDHRAQIDKLVDEAVIGLARKQGLTVIEHG